MTKLMALAVVLFALFTEQCGAQGVPAAAFPTQQGRPIRLVVPFPAGGASDVVARVVAQKLGEVWKQPMVVENRPGASGAVAAEFVIRSQPDGYTLLLGGPASLTGPAAINPALPYDPLKDFAPVSVVAKFPTVISVSPSVAKTLPELIALLKANPDKYTYASSGSGTSSHLIAELFKYMTGTRILHIPYRGSAPGLNDVISGQVSMSFEPINVVLPLVREGRLIALGVSSRTRAPELPNVPPIADVAPGFEVESWLAFLAPAGTRPEVARKIASDVNQAVHSPETEKRLRDMSMTPVGSEPDELTRTITNDLEKWRMVARVANIRAD